MPNSKLVSASPISGEPESSSSLSVHRQSVNDTSRILEAFGDALAPGAVLTAEAAQTSHAVVAATAASGSEAASAFQAVPGPQAVSVSGYVPAPDAVPLIDVESLLDPTPAAPEAGAGDAWVAGLWRDLVGYATIRASGRIRHFVAPEDVASEALLVVIQLGRKEAVKSSHALGFRVVRCLYSKARRTLDRRCSTPLVALEQLRSPEREEAEDEQAATGRSSASVVERCLAMLLSEPLVHELSCAQRAVCHRLGRGLSARAIGRELGMETRTVTRAICGAGLKLQRFLYA